MADYRDTFTSEIYVNQSQAQDAIEKYTKKLADLNKQLAEIDKSEEGWEKKEKKLQKQIKSTEGSLKSVQVGVENYQKAMNSLDGRSLSNLIKLKKQLNAEIKKLVPGTQEYIRLTEDYKKVEARIKSIEKATKLMNEETRRSKSIVDSAVGFFNKYWSMFDTLTRTISGVSMKFRQCAEDAAKLDDVYADVMKTTGLLHEEVEGLDKELMKINTRTSREQLLLLARDAGKLGIQGKENILGFVRAADQIQVALGEDLGEGAIRNLGKIADVLGYTKSMGIEKSLLSIASSINAVGQASTASESYLVDFTQRMAGVAAQTGISAANIIGFASGLDQSAMKVEMASTAFQKFLMKLYEDPAKFAAYANLEVGKFTELLQNDANQAVITILKALKDQDGFASLVPIFKDMGLDGARAVSVLAAMATNINAVTEAQAVANDEFEKATSVTEEYNTKNNNMQAQLEKARKEFHNASVTLGQSLNPIMLKSTKATTYLIKAIAQYGKEIKTVLVVIVALTAALKAKVAWQKIVATWNATLRAGSLALAAAQALLTGNVTRAAAAWAMMNTAMKASVFGVVVAAVSGLVILLQRLNKETKQLTEYQKFEKKLTEDVAKATSEEATRVKALKSIVEDSNQAYQERKLALQELKRIVPDYHADLTEEGVLINNNTEALDNYINAMLKAAKTQVLQDRLRENAGKQLEQEQFLTENAPAEFRDALGNWRRSYTEAGPERENGTSGIITHWISQDCEAAIDRLEEFKKEEALILDMIRQAGDEGIITTATGSGGGGGGNGLTASDRKADDKRYQERLKALEQRQRDEQNLINQQYFNGEINAEQHEKALRDITMKYLVEKLELAKANGKDITQVEASILSERMKNRKGDYDKELKQLEARQREEEQSLSLSLSAQEITEKEYHAKSLELKMRYLEEKLKLTLESGQDETAVLQAIFDAQIEAEKAAYDEMKKLKEDAKKVIAGLDPSSARQSELKSELDKLEELHQAKLLSEEQYEEAVKQMRQKYADEEMNERLGDIKDYLEKANKAAELASNFVTSLKEAETAQMEAEYQKQLTAAGDNAEEREAIEADYEKKKLDLQKKYADIDMAINIAKTIANGAAAAIKAYMEGGPYAGPVLAALIAATTAAEVATIIAQRNAIKNASVSASTGSGTAATTGERTMTGYSEGGFTPRAASDRTAVGVVHANEYVAPAWMVRQNPVTFANLERYRRAGSHGRSGTARRGFADGGFTGSPGGMAVAGVAPADMLKAVKEGAKEGVMEALEGRRIQSVVQFGDIMIASEKHQKLKRLTSL